MFDAIDEVQAGFLAGDEYRRAADLRAQDAAEPGSTAEWAGLAEMIAEAPQEVLSRVLLAVAVLHVDRPDGCCGVCAGCRPRRWRWWRRSPGFPCPTRRTMFSELRAGLAGPRSTLA